MPKLTVKKRAAEPHNQPQENAESHDEPTLEPTKGKTKKKTKSAHAGHLAVTPFGAIPIGCTHFAVRRQPVDGSDIRTAKRLAAVGNDGSGLEVRQFPISELSADFILARWGEGDFIVQWLGRTGKGASSALGWGGVVGVRAPAAPAPPPASASPAASSPLTEALQLFTAFEQIAQTKTQNILAMATGMMQAARPADGGAPSAIVQMLTEENRRLSRQVQQLLDRISDGDDDGDEEEDDDDDDEEPAGGGGLFKPGVSPSDTIKAAALNELAGLATDAVPFVREYIKKVAVDFALRSANGAPPAATPAAAALPSGATSGTTTG